MPQGEVTLSAPRFYSMHSCTLHQCTVTLSVLRVFPLPSSVFSTVVVGCLITLALTRDHCLSRMERYHAMSHHISNSEPPHLPNEPAHLQQWATTSPTMSHHISPNEPPHLQQLATTSPTMSHHISNNEPPHLQQLATTSPTMSHHISPMSHHISHELLFCYHKIF